LPSSTFIPINKPWIDEQEKQEVINVLEENALTTAARDGGKRVRDFESQMRDYLKVKHVVAVNSGTAALYAALIAAGIKEGDEVLIPSFTFVATANAVVAAQGKPVFVDVKGIERKDKHSISGNYYYNNNTDTKADDDYYTIDVSDLKSKITDKSKVIIPVHLYGHPADMDEILELADKQNPSINVIEDACQSLGSTYKKKQTGTLGTMGCFSMYASKVLTAGEGGAVVTDSDELADRIKMIRNHGMVEGYDTRMLGLNLRLPELSAAVAKIQMQKLEKMLKIRRRNAELLTKELASTAERHGIVLPQETTTEDDGKKFNWYLYTIAFLDDDGDVDNNIEGRRIRRDEIKDKLVKEYNIGATVYYDPPVHLTPYYFREFNVVAPSTSSASSLDNTTTSSLSSTEWCAKHVLSLPVHPSVSETDIEHIANSIKLILEK
jgi:dTDP-4-amino-4,6-dideoxygalactose transaminase